MYRLENRYRLYGIYIKDINELETLKEYCLKNNIKPLSNDVFNKLYSGLYTFTKRWVSHSSGLIYCHLPKENKINITELDKIDLNANNNCKDTGIIYLR